MLFILHHPQVTTAIKQIHFLIIPAKKQQNMHFILEKLVKTRQTTEEYVAQFRVDEKNAQRDHWSL